MNGIYLVISLHNMLRSTAGAITKFRGGSYQFGGSNRYLSIPAGSDWAVGTGDFCVEWFQYQTQASPPAYSRLFQVGEWPNHSIAVSIESGNFYVWLNAGSTFYSAGALSNYLNKWVHFAFVRQSGLVSVYQNGVRILNQLITNNITNTVDNLQIGYGSGNYWNGYVTNFRFVNGSSVYDASQSTITVPKEPLTEITGTKLLLLAKNRNDFSDSSSLNKSITNVSDVTWSPSGPF